MWRLYLNKWPQEYKKQIWHTFGPKVGQIVRMQMKLEIPVWHCLLDVHTKFQMDIPKHVDKKPGNLLKNPKHAKIIIQIPKIWFLPKTELMSKSIQWATYVPNV